jgi:hypothetical protein
MLAPCLEFKWSVSDTKIEFLVREPLLHRRLYFVDTFVHKHKRTPNLSEWLDFFNTHNFDRDTIQRTINFFNKCKKEEPKNQKAFERIFCKNNKPETKPKARVVVKKLS